MIGKRHYKPERSNQEVQRLRAIANAIHEQSVDYYVELEKKLSAPKKLDHPVYAIRGWHINSSTGLLCSLAMPYDWESPVEVEKKNVSRKGVAGFWAVKPNHVGIVAGYSPTIVGIVELSGRVVEHDFGWRGEVCLIVELFTFHFNLRALEHVYHCDVSYGDVYTARERLLGR